MGLSHEEIQALLGAYALDATDPEESARVAEHLVACPQCQAEVVEHRETAALLAHAGGPAPEGLWDRIAAELDEAPEEPVPAPVVPLLRRPAEAGAGEGRRRRTGRSSGWRRAGLAASGVAAAAVIGILGWRVVEQDRRLDEMDVAMEEDAVARAASEAMADPTARHAELKKTTGEMAAVAVARTDGEAYLLADALPPLGTDLTYQLWGVLDSGRIVSLGVLGAQPGVVALQVPDAVGVLVITEEPAGGVTVSEAPPMATGQLA